MNAMQMFLTKLNRFLSSERGRKSKLARELGLSRQSVSAWCGQDTKKVPDGTNILLLLSWLRENGEDPDRYLPAQLDSEAILTRKRRGGPADGAT